MKDETSKAGDERIMQGWYAYAAEQPGSVGSWLRMVQERLNQQPSHQQREFGASDDQFLRLRGMRLPRPDHFTEDSQRIALACGLANPFAFSKAMLLARGMAGADTDTTMGTAASPNTDRTTNIRPIAEPRQQYYMAAFDSQDDLNVLPDLDAPAETPSPDSPHDGPPEPEDERE